MRWSKQRKESKIDESWLLPYADLLTLLVALFIVLFAMSEIDTQKYKELSQVFKNEFSGGEGILEYKDSPVKHEEGLITDEDANKDQDNEKEHDKDKDKDKEKEEDEKSKAAAEREELEVLQQKINNFIKGNNLAESLETALTDEGLLITILNDVSFNSGSAEVKADGRDMVRNISEFLHTDPPHQVVVSGHADDRPIHNVEFASNWELSVIRAVNFMGLLLENDNLDPERFSAKGFGEHQPLLPNTSEENRAKNRRVEVLILPNYDLQAEGENEEI